MLRKTPKEKIKEIVEHMDINSLKNKDKIKNMIRNNRTISDYAKHLPKK